MVKELIFVFSEPGMMTLAVFYVKVANLKYKNLNIKQTLVFQY